MTHLKRRAAHSTTANRSPAARSARHARIRRSSDGVVASYIQDISIRGAPSRVSRSWGTRLEPVPSSAPSASAGADVNTVGTLALANPDLSSQMASPSERRSLASASGWQPDSCSVGGASQA
jgi:hypothetical protein